MWKPSDLLRKILDFFSPARKQVVPDTEIDELKDAVAHGLGAEMWLRSPYYLKFSDNIASIADNYHDLFIAGKVSGEEYKGAFRALTAVSGMVPEAVEQGQNAQVLLRDLQKESARGGSPEPNDRA